MTWFHENQKRVFYFVGLSLYGFLLYFLFVILTFPKTQVQNWMLFQFQKATQTEVTVSETRFTFPLGTEWKKITFFPSGKPETRFELDQMKIDFSLASFLFKRKMSAHFNLKGWGGDIRGAWSAEGGNKTSRNSVVVEGEELELGRFPWNKGVTIAGKVKFQTEYRWEAADPGKGKGFINIEGNEINGRGLSISGFNLPEIAVSRLTGHGILRDGSMTVDRFVSTGALADLNGTGTILINTPFEKSLLNLSFKITPKEALNKIVPLAFLSPSARSGVPMDLYLKGTLEQPAFTLTGAPT
ncbi:MAG: type II secretion system protein GspN [Nitrospirae bacterium]|nr:type II secretion system protein GspN [Nitrospirota bacterium]MBI3351390.1 type II secretion system protein GspN [Nitrospirota bacterium]